MRLEGRYIYNTRSKPLAVVINDGEPGTHTLVNLYERMTVLVKNSQYFEHNGLLCIVRLNAKEVYKITTDHRLKWILTVLPFVRFLVSEDDHCDDFALQKLAQGTHGIWLEATAYTGMAQNQHYEALILSGGTLTNEQVPHLINQMYRFCERIVIQITKEQQVELPEIEQLNLWGIQYYDDVHPLETVLDNLKAV